MRTEGTSTNTARLHIVWMALGIYIISVLYITLISRIHAIPSYTAVFTPLYSYTLAWKAHSLTQWMNIIFNYVMFIPLGILLPMSFKTFHNWKHTYLVGLVFTTCIEVTQLITHLGIFETDDIINNALGCMIGFGIYELVKFIICKLTNRKGNILNALLTQIPLLVVSIAFTYIFSANGIYTTDVFQYLMR